MGDEPQPESVFDASRHSALFHLLGLLAVVALALIMAVVVRNAALPDLEGAQADLATAALALGFSAALLLLTFLPALRTLVAADRAHINALEAELEDVLTQRSFDDRLMRALEVADTESAVMRVTARALSELFPDRSASLLLADPHEDKVRWHVEVVDGALGASTPVESSAGCVALRTSHTVSHPSTAALDACPHTSNEAQDVSSVCVPVDVAGDHVVVLNVLGSPGELPALRPMQMLESLAKGVGHRLAALRVVAANPAPNSVDPLTGVLNRRAMEDLVYGLVRDLVPFSVAWCDLDELARYNDERGYEAGDRALRLTAQVLRDGVRPGDLVGRHEGDDFVIVFPSCSALSAVAALERMRDSLVISQHNHDVPIFTISAGVADSNQGKSIEEIFATARGALNLAKNEGRNRVRVAGGGAGGSDDDASHWGTSSS